MAAQKKDLDYYLAQARRISEHREAGAERAIRREYKAILKDLQQFVSETYVQYAQEDRLTFAMLQQAGYNARFLEEIEQRLNIATPRAAQKLTELVEETYKAAYESMVDGVARASGGLDAAFAESIAITPEQVKAAVENPVSGLTLKDTLEKNRREIIYGIKQTVGVGLMNGDRYTTMAKRIAKHVDGDYTKAIRIARTETHRVREAGNHDAAVYVDAELQKGTTGMRMVKTWKTMQDERVRPQRRRKGKKGWSTKMGKGADHMILNEQTVLEDEPFDLGYHNGKKVEAMMPGSSGVAGHDINCRCYASRKMMTDEEYFKATGKHFPGFKKEAEKAAESTPDVIPFTPAKSKTEAEEYAKEKGVKYVDYSKLPLDTANELNHALGTLPDGVRPVFVGDSNTLEQYWGAKLKRRSKDYYGVTIDVFDGIHLGPGKYDFDTTGKMVGISSTYKTADKIKAAKEAFNIKYAAKYPGRTWFFNANGATTPYHEMGHVYASVKGLPKGFEHAAAKWAAESRCDMLTKPEEAFAEAWAAYHTGANEIPDYIRKFIDDVAKK